MDDHDAYELPCPTRSSTMTTTTTTTTTEFVSLPHLQIKDELLDDPEITEVNFNASSVVEIDPMNLLDLGEEHAYFDAVTDQFAESDSNSASIHTASHTAELLAARWRCWTSEFPWMLHDGELDGPEYGYCLYCDLNLVITRRHNIKKHAQSAQHKDRAESYMAFQQRSGNSAAGSAASELEVKEEVGSVAAAKQKRKAIKEALDNYNWSRWLEAHEWLQRDEGVTGHCKYCCIKLCVEFAYQRYRHEERRSHKLEAKLHKLQQAQPTEGGDEQLSEAATDEEGTRNVDSSSKLEKIPYVSIPDEPNLCLCGVCQVKMTKLNFRKHLKTQMHVQNMLLAKKSKRPLVKAATVDIKDEYKDRWKPFQREHPWLAADPVNSAYGYCKYCERRLMFGMSKLKREMHENSMSHKQALAEYKKRQRRKSLSERGAQECAEYARAVVNADYGDEEEEDEEEEEEVSSDFSTEDYIKEVDSEANEHDSKMQLKRPKRGSDAWFTMIPWCERYLKDPNYVYCKYCDVLLTYRTLARSKHERSLRHVQQEKAFLRLDAAKAASLAPSATIKKEKRIPLYAWLTYSKSNPKNGYCKYCRMRLSGAWSRAKHEASNRHREAELAYLRRRRRKSESKSQELCPTADGAGSGQESAERDKEVEAAKTLWQQKYTWLTYKHNEMRPNYGYCTYCEQRIFLPTAKFASKHQRSAKHLRVRLQMKRQQMRSSQDLAADDAAATTGEHNSSANIDDEEDDEGVCESGSADLQNSPRASDAQTAPLPEEVQKKYPWLLPDSKNNKNYGHCSYCDLRLMTCGILKDNHETSQRHRNAEKLVRLTNAARGADINAAVAAPSDDDVTEVIDASTIEVLSVKSESTDAEEEASAPAHVSAHALRSKRRSGLHEIGSPPAKRKRTASHLEAINLARRLTSAHAEIMRLTRSFSSKSNSSCGNADGDDGRSKVDSAPPAARPQQHHPPASLVGGQAPADRNTYDLFFDSVSETVKNLPTDLAAESKIKVMQIVYDLEMRALRRRQDADSFNAIDSTASVTTNTQADTPSTTTNGYDLANGDRNVTPPSCNNTGGDRQPPSSYVGTQVTSTPHSAQHTDPSPRSAAKGKRVPFNSSVRCIPIDSLTVASAAPPESRCSPAGSTTVKYKLIPSKGGGPRPLQPNQVQLPPKPKPSANPNSNLNHS